MTTLREFVLERIHEEELAAQSVIDRYPANHRWSERDAVAGAYPRHWDPWRALTGCMAKRLLVNAHCNGGPSIPDQPRLSGGSGSRACADCGRYGDHLTGPCYTLRVLALHWVDHPSYRNEWRPDSLRRVAGSC